MNIKSISINTLALLVCLTGYHFLFNKNKVPSLAYIETAKLMTEYKGMKDAKKIIEVKTSACTTGGRR